MKMVYYNNQLTQEMNIDMLSASGHKFHGPKGIGFLYVSNKVKIGSFIHGGSQERSRRAGTHNVPGIIGMAKAASIANTNMSENIKNISAIRDHTNQMNYVYQQLATAN